MRPRFRDSPQLLFLPWFAMGMSAYGVHFSVKFIPFDIFVLGVVKEASIIFCTVFLILIYNKVSKIRWNTGCLHQLMDLDLVDFDLGSSSVCPIPLRQMGFWQKWLSDRARWWNLSQSNPSPRAHVTPCRLRCR